TDQSQPAFLSQGLFNLTLPWVDLPEVFAPHRDEKSRARRRFLSLGNDSRPPMNEILGLHPKFLLRPFFAKEKNCQLRFLPCPAFRLTFRDSRIAGNDNPISFVSERSNPFGIFRVGKKFLR